MATKVYLTESLTIGVTVESVPVTRDAIAILSAGALAYATGVRQFLAGRGQSEAARGEKLRTAVSVAAGEGIAIPSYYWPTGWEDGWRA